MHEISVAMSSWLFTHLHFYAFFFFSIICLNFPRKSLKNDIETAYLM